MATGNLPIFGDTEDESPKEQKTIEHRINGDDAKIIYCFFQNELKEISDVGCVQKEPHEGPIKFLIVKYPEDRSKILNKQFDNLERKIYNLPQKDVPFPKDKNDVSADFVRECESDKDLLVIPDIARSVVKIVGKTQELVDSTAHRFKVRTGEIKVTGRMLRQNSDTSEDKMSYSSIVAGKQNKAYQDPKKNMYGNSQKNFAGSFSSSSNRFGDSSSAEFSFETTLVGGMVLKVYKASITHVNVDAIVNAANDTMMHGGGVARVISEAAGYDLDRESREYVDRNGQVKVSENIVTTAGKLPYKGVIHAVGPMWHDYRDNKMQCLDDLYDCVWNILDRCKKERFKCVAMSAISAGIFAVPKELCADMYVYAAAKYSKSRSSTDCPEELHIIDVDTSILHLVEQSFKRWKQDPESINQRITLPKYLKENPHQAGYSAYSGGGHRSYGHRAGRHNRGGGENQQFKRSFGDGVRGNERRHKSPSPQNKHTEEPFGIRCTIRKQPDERFKWGGNAKLFIMDKQLTVKIYKGEINKVRHMDAIVCGTSADFDTRGFISQALQKAGGHDYTTNYNKIKEKHKSCDQGDVYKCKAGKLDAEFVFLVVSSRLVDANAKEMEAYKKCIDNVLQKAKRNEMKSLAIPMFGTGNIQTNKRKLKVCGEALLKSLDDFLHKYGNKHDIQEIHLVNNSSDVTEALEDTFNEAMNKTFKSKRNSDEYKRNDQHSSSPKGQSGPGQDKFADSAPHYSKSYSASGLTDSSREGGNLNGEGSFNDKAPLEGNDDDDYDQIHDVPDKSREGGNGEGSGSFNDEAPMEYDDDDNYDQIHVPDTYGTSPSQQANSPQKEGEKKTGNLNILEG